MYGSSVWWCIFRAGLSHTLMGQVRHGSARTTAAIRRALQHGQQSRQRIATRYGIPPNTGAKGRKRATVQEAPRGPAPASTGLTAAQAALAGAFRRHPLWPLDDGRYARHATSPPLCRAARPRCFQRHGRRRRPRREDGQRPPKQKCQVYALGYRPVDLAEGQTEAGKASLFVAIARPSQVGFAQRHPRAKRAVAAALLRRVLDKRPYPGPTVLTDNGVAFAPEPPQGLPGGHRVDRLCRE